MIDLKQMQHEILKWQDKNFPDRQPWEAVVGATEEIGELCHTYLKAHQGIRGKNLDDDVFPEEAQDAIGDCIIFLMGLCNTFKWDMEDILTQTWKEVGQRDWRK